MDDSKKKKKYYQSYKEAYSKEFSFILKSRKGDKHVFCSECAVDFSISHSGKGDIKNHIQSVKHQRNTSANVKSDKISTFFEKSDDLRTIRAECLFTSFLVEHNLPLSCADHIGPLLKKIFPENDLANSYRCGRTKSSNIVGEFATQVTEKLKIILRRQPFSVATDGSNDYDSKLYPVIVTFFNPESRSVENNLLGLPALNGDSTGVNIGNLVIDLLKNHEVPITNCISLVSDNAPVMVGKKAGVVTVLRELQPNLISVGCACHLLNLAAEKGSSVLPLNIDELLVDIYFYFKRSSKRIEKLREFQRLHDTEAKKLLKHVCTRWLSVGKCLDRLLMQWNPLCNITHCNWGVHPAAAT
nr:uncharacterized protein LOC122269650 [Parasteatoda tepidariorum]